MMKRPLELSKLTPTSLYQAIVEFDRLGRTKALRRYGFSRSSKYYLLLNERLYDTKCVLAAAYYHQHGRFLSASAFAGGNQTIKQLKRMIEGQRTIKGGKVFEDTLGELKNLSMNFDDLPKTGASLKAFGFSQWISLKNFNALNTRSLPGIYVVAATSSRPASLSITDDKIVYIGETVDQNLHKRLFQLNRSLNGLKAHSGGWTLRKKGFHRKTLWISIRSFALPNQIENGSPRMVRASMIRYLERKLIYDFVSKHKAYPPGNSK